MMDHEIENIIKGLTKQQRRHYQKALKLLREGKMNLAFDLAFKIAAYLNYDFVQHLIDCACGEGTYRIVSFWTQKDYQSRVDGRAVRLDFIGVDTKGKLINIEIQMNHTNSIFKKSRLNQAYIDAFQLGQNTDTNQLQDVLILSFVDRDIGKHNEASYTYSFSEEKYHDRPNVGVKYTIVNLRYEGRDSPLGKLIGDLKQTEESKMSSEVMVNALKYVKEGGDTMMVKAIKGGPEAVRRYLEDEARKKAVEETKTEFVRNMHSSGKDPEEIAFLLQLPLDEVKKYLRADEA